MFSLLPQARAGVIDQRVEDVSQVAIWSTSAFFFLAIFRQKMCVRFSVQPDLFSINETG
jgi:hypothetical protein